MDHTEPAGNPALEVGIFLIDKLLTNVEQARSDVIPEPIMNEWQYVVAIVFLQPPTTEENNALAMLQ